MDRYEIFLTDLRNVSNEDVFQEKNNVVLQLVEVLKELESILPKKEIESNLVLSIRYFSKFVKELPQLKDNPDIAHIRFDEVITNL